MPGSSVTVINRNEQVRRQLDELLADERPAPEALLHALQELRDAEGVQAFSLALYRLAHLNLPEVQAERLLADLLRRGDA